MDDEPMPTRWSFQDFKLFYDAKFGRKKILENGHSADKHVNNGTSAGIACNGSQQAQNASDRAIYEQFQNQGQNSTQSNGFSPNNIDERPQKSLLPPFESAEMRALGESLSRDIIRGSPDVKWESIKGLENAKRLLKEAVVMPIKYPKETSGVVNAKRLTP
ncbi:katanin p60 ATPase-containing subunit A-like 2 [Senna tora]|uniref:Katanin p60 ATPase-containing subunit A-like 2 n=1 Tax=Senna tora TaxID=362788 RepID=A0A834SFT1_9FABA|nr:katanin p60 ATPase-containing subunit A-like 2 [Senna tora]